METEDIKIILLSIDTIEKAREILSESLQEIERFYFDELTESGRFDIHCLGTVCERLKNDLGCADNNTRGMRESLSMRDETEIEDAVILIEDILTDNIPPKAKPFSTNMLDVAHRAAGFNPK